MVNPEHLERLVLEGVAKVSRAAWVPFSLGELRNRVVEADKQAADASSTELVETVVALEAGNQLSIQKWQGSPAILVPYDRVSSQRESYISAFFLRGSFELRLTHDGRKTLGRTEVTVADSISERDEFDDRLPLYRREELANGILAKLDELFPKPTSSDDLKEFQVRGFEKEPKKTWLEAIDGLLKHGLAEGKPLYEGEGLVYATNLLITRIGREEIRRIRGRQASSSNPTLKSKLVFLSHAAKDQEIAISMKRVIENAISGADVFVSSDTEDLRPGDEWVRKILEKLQEARMLLILATDRGLSRPWVWFETGAGWRSELRMIPCCLGRARKNQLFAPFSSYQSLNVDEDRDLLDLLREVSRELQLPLEMPETPSIIAELQRLDQVAHDSEVSMLTPDEIQRRVDMVHVSASISQGYSQNFVVRLENESEETVRVREICLLNERGVRLTEPYRLDSKEPDQLEPKGRLEVAWRMQTNPAVALMSQRTRDTPSIDAQHFETDIEIIVTCQALGKIKRCPSKLRVQVDVWNLSITQIAG